MIDVDNSFNKLLVEITPFFPKEELDRILNDTEKCRYVEALQRISAHIGPIAEYMEVDTVALLLESWTLLCRYRRLRTDEAEFSYKRFYEDGQETWTTKFVSECLEHESYWLKCSEAGKKKATSYYERSKSAKVNNKSIGKSTAMQRTSKPKYE